MLWRGSAPEAGLTGRRAIFATSEARPGALTPVAERSGPYDAIIIGAGLSGMYQLHRLRGSGCRVRVFEAGGGVGGTWYWNRYPGRALRFRELDLRLLVLRGDPARVGVERALRRAAGDTALLQLRRRQARPAPRHRRSTAGSGPAPTTRPRNEWEVDDRRRPAGARAVPDHRDRARCRRRPCRRIPGVEDFRGESYHTGTWPHEPVSFASKRVAVIGTGATGVQAITEIAKTVGHLTVFQRTPNWCAPLHNARSTPATQARDQGDATRRSSRAAARRSAASSTRPIRAMRSR